MSSDDVALTMFSYYFFSVALLRFAFHGSFCQYDFRDAGKLSFNETDFVENFKNTTDVMPEKISFEIVQNKLPVSELQDSVIQITDFPNGISNVTEEDTYKCTNSSMPNTTKSILQENSTSVGVREDTTRRRIVPPTIKEITHKVTILSASFSKFRSKSIKTKLISTPSSTITTTKSTQTFATNLTTMTKLTTLQSVSPISTTITRKAKPNSTQRSIPEVTSPRSTTGSSSESSSKDQSTSSSSQLYDITTSTYSASREPIFESTESTTSETTASLSFKSKDGQNSSISETDQASTEAKQYSGSPSLKKIMKATDTSTLSNEIITIIATATAVFLLVILAVILSIVIHRRQRWKEKELVKKDKRRKIPSAKLTTDNRPPADEYLLISANSGDKSRKNAYMVLSVKSQKSEVNVKTENKSEVRERATTTNLSVPPGRRMDEATLYKPAVKAVKEQQIIKGQTNKLTKKVNCIDCITLY